MECTSPLHLSPSKENLISTKARIKKHFSKNKKVYIAIGTTAVVVGTGAYILHLRMKSSTPTVNVSDIYDGGSAITNVADMMTINNIHIPRRMHPGFIVQCNETGVTWPSIRKAASDLGVSYSRLRQHLNGEELNVFGFTYTILGEAHAPI